MRVKLFIDPDDLEQWDKVVRYLHVLEAHDYEFGWSSHNLIFSEMEAVLWVDGCCYRGERLFEKFEEITTCEICKGERTLPGESLGPGLGRRALPCYQCGATGRMATKEEDEDIMKWWDALEPEIKAELKKFHGKHWVDLPEKEKQ